MRTINRKKRKFAGDVCYFCGKPDPDTNEDIPGKQFGVNEQTGGLIVPAHHICNRDWNRDQLFFRLRMVLNAGTEPGARHSQTKELKRIKSGREKPPDVTRYSKERAKIFFIDGKMYMGLTDMDLDQFSIVLRHWAAGIHYFKKRVLAELPGSVYLVQPGALEEQKFSPKDRGEWKATDGSHFGFWWFLPGPEPQQSAIIISLLQSSEQWYAVRFPALHNKSPMMISNLKELK